MEDLERSRTFENIKRAFLEEASLVFRYLYYAIIADYEGLDRHSALFREIAEGGTTNVHGSFDFLAMAADPDSGIPVGGTFKNLESLLQTETRQQSRTYPEMARTAREEGFNDVASWFDTLEKLKRAHVARLEQIARD